MAEPIVLDAATLRSTVLVTEGEPPADPAVEITATDADGRIVRLRIVGGVGAGRPCAELATVTRRLFEASDRAEDRRMRRLAEQAFGGRPGGAS